MRPRALSRKALARLAPSAPKPPRLDGEMIRRRHQEGQSVEQIAAEFGVCPRTMSTCLR